MKDSPRILHVSTPKSWRGGEQQLAYLFEQLQSKGIHQHIICASGSEMEQKCKAENWSFSAVPVKSSLDFSFAKKIRDICLEQKIDVVHTHDSKGHTFAVLAATFYRNQASIVVSRRVDFPVSSSPLSKWKYNHKKVARIVCVSDGRPRLSLDGLASRAPAPPALDDGNPLPPARRSFPCQPRFLLLHNRSSEGGRNRKRPRPRRVW